MSNKDKILSAAAAGNVTLAQIEDGEDFDSVAEWVEYASERDAEELAISLGLADDGGPEIFDPTNERKREMAARGDIH